jgi:hypothetical protein
VVARRDGGDDGAIDRDAVARDELVDVREADAPQRAARALRRDHAHAAPDQPQRPDVEVIEVDVGDQHGIDPLDHVVGRRRPVAAQVGKPPAQQRIGQQAHAADLEQHGRMADPGQALLVARHGADPADRAGEATSPVPGDASVERLDARR